MYHNKMKVITSIALALSITLGILAVSATNLVFAAPQPASGVQPVQVGGFAPSSAAISTTVTSTATVTTTKPMTGTAPAGVTPYATGQTSSYGKGGTSQYNGLYGSNGRYRLFNFGRFMRHDERGPLDRIFDRGGSELLILHNGEKILLGRGKTCLIADFIC